MTPNKAFPHQNVALVVFPVADVGRPVGRNLRIFPRFRFYIAVATAT